MRVLSFALFALLAVPVESAPQRKKGGKKGNNAATGAAAGAGAVAATKITQAADGSMILDKTVTIG